MSLDDAAGSLDRVSNLAPIGILHDELRRQFELPLSQVALHFDPAFR